MDFWTGFEVVYTHIWEILDSPMTFGGITVSFWDLIIVSGVIYVLSKIVSGIIYDIGE